MTKTILKTLLILVILLLIVGGVFVWNQSELRAPNPSPSPISSTSNLYQSTTHDFTFAYPTVYFLSERNLGTPTTPHAAIILAEDTLENREVIEGRASEPREGPPTITVDVYANPNQLPAEQWISNSMNWTLSNQQTKSSTVGNQPALSYTWSGLYEGISTVVTYQDRAYVITVTYLATTDQILTDYQTVLNSFKFYKAAPTE